MVSFEFVDRRGKGVVSSWRLERRERKKLERKLRLLHDTDRQLAEGSIIFSLGGGLWEVEVRGNVQLRPRACLGPADPDDEVTFLVAAVKKDNKIDPPDADQIAARNLERLRRDPQGRRKLWPPPGSK